MPGPPMPPTTTTVVVCHTEGCTNEGVPLTIELPDGADVACGPCGNPITDITPEGTPS